MMERGHQDSQRADVAHTDVELILQHPRPLVTHISKRLLPPRNIIMVHTTKNGARTDDSSQHPQYEESFSPLHTAFQALLHKLGRLLLMFLGVQAQPTVGTGDSEI